MLFQTLFSSIMVGPLAGEKEQKSCSMSNCSVVIPSCHSVQSVAKQFLLEGQALAKLVKSTEHFDILRTCACLPFVLTAVSGSGLCTAADTRECAQWHHHPVKCVSGCSPPADYKPRWPRW